MKSLNFRKSILMLVAMVVFFTVRDERANAEFVEGPATNLGPAINSSYGEHLSTVTLDGLELYFSSNRPGGEGGDDIWASERTSTNKPWSEPVNLGPTINSASADGYVCISADGLELYFSSDRGDNEEEDDPWGGLNRGSLPDDDLYVTKRASRSEPWGSAENLERLNESDYDEKYSYLSADGLKIYFYSNRPTDYIGSTRVWVSTRDSKEGSWSRPSEVGTRLVCEFGTGICEEVGEAYVDVYQGAKIFSSGGEYFRIFTDKRPDGYGGNDLWQVQIQPVLDLNGDGIVDIKDLARFIDCWDQEESPVDIAPGPYGDEIVDINDLELLMSYWEREVNDISLVAHWKLDETEGDTAYDSAGGYDGALNGEPLWQPDSGIVGGALEFDGIDDYVFVELPLTALWFDSLSIIAWIKGGEPGQVIFSQSDVTNWLMADVSSGELMAEQYDRSGRDVQIDWSLQSDMVITDGQWHRIGFVWEERYERRYGILYVDDVEVAVNLLADVNFFTGYMLIGVGVGYHASWSQTLWTGLIDDVRVYNRAIKP